MLPQEKGSLCIDKTNDIKEAKVGPKEKEKIKKSKWRKSREENGGKKNKAGISNPGGCG